MTYYLIMAHYDYPEEWQEFKFLGGGSKMVKIREGSYGKSVIKDKIESYDHALKYRALYASNNYDRHITYEVEAYEVR